MWIETSSALRMASKIDGLNPPDTSATYTMKIRIPFGSLSGGKGGRRRSGREEEREGEGGEGEGEEGGEGEGGGEEGGGRGEGEERGEEGGEGEDDDNRYKLLFAS